MLCRVAEDLFWMSRDVERAISTGRIIDVMMYLELDAGPEQEAASSFLDALMPGYRDGLDTQSDPSSLQRYLALEQDNPNSLVACLRRARTNARGVRDTISSEMWEQINRLYLSLSTPGFNDTPDDNPQSFFVSIREGLHFFQGIVDSTLARDEPWLFITLGKYLERADAITRIVAAQAPFLLGEEGTDDAAVRWLAILRSCGSAEAYARHYAVRVEPARVLEFMLLNPSFPQSVRFCIASAHEALTTLSGTSLSGERAPRPVRTLGLLRAQLEHTAVDEILEDGLPSFLREIQAEIAAATNQIAQTYFQEGLAVASEPAATRAAVIMAAHQQQQ
ncbi:MAG: alpha-E domain-containing protein [Chloroflexota bacterium]